MLRKAVLPTFNSVPASGSAGTATVDLPLGIKYGIIWLEFGDDSATTLASGNLVGDIRVKVNGKVQRNHSAVQLNAINNLNGTAFAAKIKGATTAYRTYLPIFFAEPWRKDVNQMMLPAWNAVGIQSFQIEVDLKAVTCATNTRIQGFYEWAPATGPIGSIAKIIRQSLPAVGTIQDYNTLDRRDYLQSIHMFTTSDSKCAIKAKLTADGNIVHDLIDAQQNQAILLAREMNPETGTNNPRYDIVFDYDDPINNALDAGRLSELTLHAEFGTYTTATGAFAVSAASGTMDTLIVRAGPPD